MKKLFVSACMALALFAMVACSNPGIDAAKDFIDDPTLENLTNLQKVEATLSGDELKEYNEWCAENAEEIMTAGFKCGMNNSQEVLNLFN